MSMFWGTQEQADFGDRQRGDWELEKEALRRQHDKDLKTLRQDFEANQVNKLLQFTQDSLLCLLA